MTAPRVLALMVGQRFIRHIRYIGVLSALGLWMSFMSVQVLTLSVVGRPPVDYIWIVIVHNPQARVVVLLGVVVGVVVVVPQVPAIVLIVLAVTLLVILIVE